MTDEEKAEEYVTTIQHDINNWGGKEPTERFYNEIKLKQAYLDGLAEGKPKWHDLRENSKDLPKENGHYWCKWNDGSYCTEHYFQDYGFGSYVIAWCELPMFEE